jgi:Leucine-rich repeat (LRR) protein
MKNFLLSLLFLISLSGQAQYTAIPDLNFEKALIALNLDSGVPDAKVLTSVINQVTYLDVSSKSIADLTGIQDFTALSELRCNSNLLTTLDLSQNIALTDLYCHKNKLKTLNITQNINLGYLDCYINPLKVIDVSQNVNLYSLDCHSNQLSVLNVAANTALASLLCYNNLLTTLDVSKNTALDNLRCEFNTLSILDISKNTVLQTLNCSFNALTVLDISKNTILRTLTCQSNQLTALNVSLNTALFTLDCRSNLITSLDVSNNVVKLSNLFCNSNKLTTLDLSQNFALLQLDCSYNLLTSLNLKNGSNFDIDTTVSNFKNNPNLTCIEVDNTIFSNAYWSGLKDAIASYSLDCTTLGVGESVFDLITISPNPTTGELHINNVFLEKVIVSNVLGQNVKTISFDNKSNNTIDLSELQKGIYYLNLKSNEASAIRKIIVD